MHNMMQKSAVKLRQISNKIIKINNSFQNHGVTKVNKFTYDHRYFEYFIQPYISLYVTSWTFEDDVLQVFIYRQKNNAEEIEMS